MNSGLRLLDTEAIMLKEELYNIFITFVRTVSSQTIEDLPYKAGDVVSGQGLCLACMKSSSSWVGSLILPHKPGMKVQTCLSQPWEGRDRTIWRSKSSFA